MRHRATFCPGRGCLLLVALLALPPGSLSAQQGPPPSPVRYTEAREHPLKRAIVLSGSVESRVTSVVASEVAGVVTELIAREGTSLKKGEPLAQLRTTPLELRLQAADASLKEAQSRMKLAERNLERARELFEAKVSSQQQLDDSYYEFNAWQGRVEQYTATIAGIKLDIERCTVRAPFNGVVTRERTELGEWIGEGDPVAEMVSLEELEVRVEVPEQYFSRLKLGVPAKITFESLPGLEISGRVSAVIPQADVQARTFPLKVRIPNNAGRIGAGMLAQVSFPGGESYRATVVPKDAVVTRGEQKFVYLLNGDNSVSQVTVQTGAGVGAWIEVHGGIRAGQRVVTRGNERLRPGQLVQGSALEYELP